tara:strand:+ start:170371 stop:170928 length:558 start_codon:yes stop_codon:yes gene_type:complete
MYSCLNEKTIIMIKLGLVVGGLGLVLMSCGGGSGGEQQPETKKVQLQSGPEETTKSADIPEVAELTIEGNDQMKFNTKRMKVYEGQKVKLTLKNVGELPVESMGHNWVLLKKGTDKNAFAEASIGAKETGYIAPDQMENVIVNTNTIGGGEEVTIEFDTPAKGSYDFICSFPGHVGMMSGKFVVQ